MTYLVQESKEGKISYKSLLVSDPSSLTILGNKIAMKVIEELGKEPSCALDLARKLKLHEQKVYYHIRKLESGGIIKLVRLEERTGGTAKIYGIAQPVVSIKLNEDGFKIPSKVGIKELDFFRPFIEDGKLNAKIIVGSPYKHGKFDATARDNPAAIDLAFFLGNLVSDLKFPCYTIDTEVQNDDIKKNLILIGGAKVNVITEKVNDKLPIRFDTEHEFQMVSRKTNAIYKYDYDCVVLRTKNPFNEKSEIILVAGKRSAGTKSGVIAFTQHLDKIVKGAESDKSFARIVTGSDKDGDGIIDSIKFLE